jgi:membrane protein DedA with SNARE-associated domain
MELIRELIDWYMQNIGYLTVFLLMMIEGSFIPMPSELVIPPAAFLPLKARLNFVMVVVVEQQVPLTGAFDQLRVELYTGPKS